MIRQRRESFLSKLVEITGIEQKILLDPSAIQLTAAATKMAWAARRQTTREEDLAYALMGLFGVNMPILYGEGLKKAFRRLQLEIIQMTTDQSIFVWRSERESSGLLAGSPRDFADSGLSFIWKTPTLQPYSMTNMGLSVSLPVIKQPDGSYAAAISCWVLINGESKRICLFLRRYRLNRPSKSTNKSENQIYRRERCMTFDMVASLSDYMRKWRDIYVMEDEQYEHLLWANRSGVQ